MIAIQIEKVQKVQKDFYQNIESQRKLALEKLEALKNNSRITFCIEEMKYLSLIINLFQKEGILLSPPNEIEYFKSIIGPVPLNSRGKGLKKLKDFIIDKLNYKNLRSSTYPKYFNAIGIKACVYCNAVLTISTKHKRTRSYAYIGNFDVDHYHSKDKFPFLSIFLFNLYPACAPCNRKKSNSSNIKFNLYSNDPIKLDKSDFQFKMDIGSKAKFLLTKNIEDLNFNFNSGTSGFQETFGIQQIYETQKDIIEELIVKMQMYDETNRKNLYNNFSKLQLYPDLYLRTLVGTYIKQHEIHKRPMTKFMQDIARELDIID